MENPKLSPLMKRLITAFLLVPFAISVLIVGSPLFEICLILVGILLAWEWASMVPSKDKVFYLGAYAFVVAVVVGFPKGWSLVIIALTTAYVFWKSKGEERRALLTLGVPYISIGIGALTWFYQEAGVVFFLWLLFVVWGMDTGGYVVGCTLKGPKLMPKISPNKTWSGLIGGLLFSVIFGSVIVWYVKSSYADVAISLSSYNEYASIFTGVYIIMGVLAMLFGFISQIGDLVESAIKRKVGVKDSSSLIPGHGGVFDRIDALIFVAPFAYLWFVL